MPPKQANLQTVCITYSTFFFLSSLHLCRTYVHSSVLLTASQNAPPNPKGLYVIACPPSICDVQACLRSSARSAETRPQALAICTVLLSRAPGNAANSRDELSCTNPGQCTTWSLQFQPSLVRRSTPCIQRSAWAFGRLQVLRILHSNPYFIY